MTERSAPPTPVPHQLAQAGAPAALQVIDGIPCGWCLRRESWTAHRMFYRQTGRAMMFKEYSRLLRKRGAGAECLSKTLNVWRMTADQGERIVVQRSSNLIRQILPPNWTPPSEPSEPVQLQPQPHGQSRKHKHRRKPHPWPTSAPAPPHAQLPQRPKLTRCELRARLGLPVD